MVVVGTAEGQDHLLRVIPMNVVEHEGNLYTCELKNEIDIAGSFKIAYRMFPKNPFLPHRQDFCYVRWFN